MNNFCQECGSPRDENAKFCPNCGFKFHQDAKEEIESREVEAPKETKDTIEIPQYENLTSQETQAPKIGGWLYVSILWLCIKLVFFVLLPLLCVTNKSLLIELCLNNNPKITIFLIYSIPMSFLSILATILFFSKDKNTKKFMLVYCVFNFSILWFFYFLFSKRVKRTFIVSHSRKSLFIKIFISLLFSITILIFFVMNQPSKQEIIEAEKRELVNLRIHRLALDDKEALLKEFDRQKNTIIQSEVGLLSNSYSFNATFGSEQEMIKYIDRAFEHKNLMKGLLYFCGQQCSPLRQNFRKSYDYLNNLNMQEKQKVFLLIAEMNLYGIGTKQNFANAVENASQATMLNEYGKAMRYYYLGLGYLYGEYYTKNIDQAIEYFKRSADLGNPASAFLSALLMATELKKKYNYQTIVKYFTRAISLGNSDANLPLAFYYYSNDELSLAEQTLQQCSKINPECKTAYQKLFE